MKVEIQMLDVKDGDAIIVHLSKESKNLLIVIDGGNKGYYESKLKPALQKKLKELNRKGPDIVVCTHYDSDHIGGLIPLVKDYKEHIKQVWVHKVPALFANNSLLITEIRNHRNKKYINGFAKFKFKEYIKENHINLNEDEIYNKSMKLIESINELKSFIDIIPSGKLKEVFYNDKPLDEWREVQILGPTKSYFSSLFPVSKSLEDFLIVETQLVQENKKAKLRGVEILEKNDPCSMLKDDSPTTITSTNKASIIIAIDTPDSRRFLFTGDAGIESFKKIPKYELKLKDLFFLKIPHHGSENNMSQGLSSLMNPQYAFNSGNEYQDDKVLKCFEKNTRNIEVSSTKYKGDIKKVF